MLCTLYAVRKDKKERERASKYISSLQFPVPRSITPRTQSTCYKQRHGLLCSFLFTKARAHKRPEFSREGEKKMLHVMTWTNLGYTFNTHAKTLRQSLILLRRTYTSLVTVNGDGFTMIRSYFKPCCHWDSWLKHQHLGSTVVRCLHRSMAESAES